MQTINIPSSQKLNLRVAEKLNWDRILFKIDPLKGVINKTISEPDLKRIRIQRVQLDNILSTLELDTHRFRSLRRYTRCKYCLIISILILLLCFILVLAITLNLTATFILLFLVIFIGVYLALILRFCKKKVVKGVISRTTGTLVDVNNKLFLNNNFYMMPTPDLTYIALYQVPRHLVNMLRIKNYFTNVNDKEQPSLDQFLHNRKPDIILQVNKVNNKY
jgi:hypothetical protein